MRSLTIVTNSLGHGGAEKQAVFVGAGLLSRGWDVRVVTLLERNDYAPRALTERTVCLHKRSKADFPRLVRAARDAIDPAIPLMCFNWYPIVLARLAHPHALRIARFGGTPSADGVTGLKRVLASDAVRTSAAVVGCSWGVTRRAVHELGQPRVLCSAIPNAVFFGENAGGEFSWPRPYIIAAGRLHPEKDHETLLLAFREIARVHPHDLLIAGDGMLESHVRRRIAELGLEGRVHMLGHRNDLESIMRGADVLLHTPTWEGFGNVIVEALGSGTPVVVTDAPYGPRGILAAVPAGRLVPVGDHMQAARATIELLADPEERARLGEIGRRLVPLVYDGDRLLDANQELISALVASRDWSGR